MACAQSRDPRLERTERPHGQAGEDLCRGGPPAHRKPSTGVRGVLDVQHLPVFDDDAINDPADDIMNVLDRDRYVFLPNTSGARDAKEAVRLARLARAAGSGDWLKLEVTPDPL